MSTKQEPKKRLNLDTETLRHLKSDDLDRILGGACDTGKPWSASNGEAAKCDCNCGA
jgi:hypothetical protein